MSIGLLNLVALKDGVSYPVLRVRWELAAICFTLFCVQCRPKEQRHKRAILVQPTSQSVFPKLEGAAALALMISMSRAWRANV
jgi:hypothetical protein